MGEEYGSIPWQGYPDAPGPAAAAFRRDGFYLCRERLFPLEALRDAAAGMESGLLTHAGASCVGGGAPGAPGAPGARPPHKASRFHSISTHFSLNLHGSI